MPRRLAIARHAEGTSPVGWVLIGVLIGAATTIFALSHADWIKRLPDPMRAPAIVAVASPAKAPPPPARLAMAATVAAPASDSQQAVAPAAVQASTMAAKPTPGEEAQVEEDAAAAGMTSHSGAASTDLN